MIDYYKKVVFENYFNFKGRASRSEFWYFTLMNLIVVLLLTGVDFLFDSVSMGIIKSIYNLAVLVPGIAVAVRRFHDIGKSGWFLLIYYVVTGVALVGFLTGTMVSNVFVKDYLVLSAALLAIAVGFSVWYLVLLCTKSEEGSNQYGAHPYDDDNELDLIGTE